MKRRILSIVTALALCLSLCPTWAWAAEREYGGQRQAARAPQYNGIVVSGEIFTEAAEITTKSIGSGTVTWDPDRAELTLENVNCVDSNASILLVTADSAQTVTLILKGKNVLNATANDGSGVVLEIHCNLAIRMEDGASLDILAGENQNAIFSPSLNLTIEGNGPVTLQSGRYPAIYGATAVNIQGGSITATSTSSNAIYSDGSIQITDSELDTTGYYPAIYGPTTVAIQGGSITATSTVSSAIYSASSLQIADANVTAQGYGCAIFTPGTLNISESTVTGHSEANHVIYTTAPITIENSELTLTSDVDTSGIFLNASSPLTISGCTNVNVTTAGSTIVSNGDVSITDSRLTIHSDDGNGIVAAVEEDNGGGTLSISGTTHIESQSAYPLTGYKVEMTGGYVKSVTSDGPAISATNGITVSGGEVYAESKGSRPSMKPAGLYSRKGEINLTGESTKVQAVSANYRAIYDEEGTISLNTNVIAKAGTYDPAFMACSVTNDVSAGPTHSITIGEGFSSEGSRPVTTKWKNETLITGYSHYAYTVLAPAGTENLQDDYLNAPSQITIAACLHPDNQCAYAHIAGTATHIRTCLDCGKTWYAENCTYTFSGATGTCAACGDSVTVTVSGTENLVYDGTGKEPGVTVTRDGTALTEGTDYTVAYADNTNTGTATVTVTIGSNQGKYTVNFTIDKATPTITWSSTSQELTYTGQQAVITAPTVTLENNENFSGVLSYFYKKQGETAYKDGLPTDAGTYTIKAHVDAAGNYTAADSREMTLTINKAQAAVINPTANTLTYTGAAQALVTAGTASVGEVVYSLTETGTYSTTIPTGTNAGSYAVWYKIADTDNYNGTAPVKVDVTIGKADYTGKKDGAASGKFGTTKTYNLAELLPEGYKLGEITTTDNDGIFADTPIVSGTTLTYKLVDDSQKVKSTGTITVPVTESTNYNSFNLIITVTVLDKYAVTLEVPNITITYGQTPQIRGTATGGDGKTLTGGTWSFKGTVPTDVPGDKVTVVFEPADADKENYQSPVEKEIQLTIDPASLTGTPTFNKVTSSGKTLADVTLTAPSGWPAGTFAWTDGDGTAVEQGKAYAYTFTPVSGNYQSYTGSATPWERPVDPPTPPVVSVTGVRLNRSTVTLKPGEGFRLTATVEPGNATRKDVTWSSSNPTVAEVDGSGNVIARTPGTAVITVRTVSGGHTSTCAVTVEAETFMITYSANGGSGIMADGTATAGRTFILPECGFTAPEGKVFDTWTIGSVSGEKAAAGSSHTFTADTTVYALWKDAAVESYTITYHANGGIGTMADSTIPSGEAFTLPGCSFTPPEGKVFDAWAIGSPSGERAGAGSVQTFTADTALYALWKDAPAVTYTVTYSANGGTGTMPDGIASDGEPFVLPECGFTAPEGKEFAGWSIGGTSGEIVDAGGSYTFTRDMTVYAVWNDIPVETYTITYHANGGSGEMAAGTAVKDVPFTLPACGFMAPEGKVFDTWHIGGTAGTSAKPGEQYVFTADTVVRAVWKDAPAITHRVTFLPNGGTGTAPTMADTAEGGTFPLPDNPFSRAGYQFSGWSYGGVIYAAGTMFTMPDSDVTFTAQWTQLAYAITGDVLQNGVGVPNAVVTLMRGTQTIAAEQTDANGRFTFSGVPVGTYNLRAEKDGITKTVKQDITSGNASLTIVLPNGRTNSVVEVKNEETPPVVVGGLDQVFTDTSVYTPEEQEIVNNGGTVEFKLTVEKQDAPLDAVKIETVKKENETVALYLDLTLTKTVTHSDGTGTNAEILEVRTLIETIVPLPAEMQGKASYTVYRVHNGVAEPLPKDSGSEYYTVSSDKTSISIFARKYSTYAIAWSDEAETPPTPPTPSRPTGGGGGSSIRTYAVTVEKSEHGKVTANRTNAASGTTVTLTVTPDAGYVLLDLAVTDSQGNPISVTDKNTFTMPSRAVTVKASFAPMPDENQEKPCDGGADCPSRAYADLSTGTWYHEAVDYAIREGLLTGYGNGTFNPNGNLSRAQLAQILYNREGRPSVKVGSSFVDVAPDSWYADAVTWAAAQGIVGGYGNGRFGPNDSITREQLAVMLWRYSKEPAATDKELHFSDAAQAGSWALDALRWAAENGILNGKGSGILDSKGLTSRAEAAQMLKNLFNR